MNEVCAIPRSLKIELKGDTLVDKIHKSYIKIHAIKCTKAKYINVHVHVSSLGIPMKSVDYTISTFGIRTHSITVSSPLGKIQHLCTLLQL